MTNRAEAVFPQEARVSIGSQEALRDMCIAGTRIFKDTRLALGLKMPGIDHQAAMPINAPYALVRYDHAANTIVAACGFELEDGHMTITHAPQILTLKPEIGTNLDVRQRALDELSDTDFRMEMIRQMLEIAKILKLERVKGLPPALSTAVEVGTLTYAEACKRIDNIYRNLGFNFREQRDKCFYELVLT